MISGMSLISPTWPGVVPEMQCKNRGHQMDVEYRYTRHQVARGARADAESGNIYYLFKNVSSLRLTYQIRLLVFFAQDHGRRLVIRVPSYCKPHPSLRAFQKEHSKTLQIERI